MTSDQFWFCIRVGLWIVGITALLGALLDWPTEDISEEDNDDEE